MIIKSSGRYICWVLVTSFIYSCGGEPAQAPQPVYDPYAHIHDDQVKRILKRAIDKAGGFEKWSEIKQIRYTKHNMLFLEDSTVEVDNIQRHEYEMQPEFKASITWTSDSIEHGITYGPEGAKKFENGMLSEQDPTETVMSAIYVLGMPFKLLDAGTTLEYTQTVTLESGKRADEIKATYNPQTHQNHSTTDQWYYYFDHLDGTFYGAMVYHPPTYAYIQNLGFHEHAGVKFHAHRKSYRSDSLRNIKYLRAEFWYSDYQVE